MEKTIPLISSGAAGPLGVVHLPRLWQKVVLSAKGALADGYDECGPGFDQMVLDGLGLDRAETLDYLKQNIPSYPDFEKWVVGKKGAIDQATKERVNQAVRGYNHKDEVRQEILSENGLSDDGTVLDAVTLNNIDDWGEFHKQLKR